jgi:hypothetical protein
MPPENPDIKTRLSAEFNGHPELIRKICRHLNHYVSRAVLDALASNFSRAALIF